MKDMKNEKILLLIPILLAAIVVFIVKLKTNYGTKSGDIVKENCEYYLLYEEDYIPGVAHEICIDSDKKVLIGTQPHCSTPECLEEDEQPPKTVEELKFSDKNKKYIDKLINEFFKDEKNIELARPDFYILSKEKINLINAFIYNDESYLDDIQ